MSERVRVGWSDGRLTAHKEAPAGPDADRLRREATVLEAAAGDGVVRLLALEADSDDTVCLRTEWVGNRSLDTAVWRDPHSIADVVLRLADLLALLHDRGLVHGRLDPTHVLLGRDSEPVLCGWAEGAAPGVPWLDGADAPTAADDVCALGEIMSRLLDELSTTAPKRFLRHAALLERRLRDLARDAVADDPLRRPRAADIAAALRTERTPETTEGAFEAARGDAPPDDPTRDAAEPEPGGSAFYDLAPLDSLRSTVDEPEQHAPFRVGAAALACLGVVVVVGVAAALRGFVSNDHRPADRTTTMQSSITQSSITQATTTKATGPKPTIDGNRISLGNREWLAGAPGDLVTIGDWNCDGLATPALLRSSTGEIFVFESWSAPGERIAIHAQQRVPSAKSLEPPTGCGAPVVRTLDDHAVTIRLGR
jgi:hypothetical protein